MRRGFGSALVVAGVLAAAQVGVQLPAKPAGAALGGLPPGFVDERVVGGLPFPTAVTFAPDGRMFVALKSGIVRVVENGAMLSTPFIDLRSRVHDNHDRGLLGIAVHPEFPQRPYVYLLYTHDPPGVTPDQGSPIVARVAQLLRVEADAATGYRTAKAGTELVLMGRNSTRANIGNELNGRDLSAASCMSPKTMSGTPVEDCIPSDDHTHTIGTVAFAPDGSLLVSSGDAATYVAVDPRAMRAQLLDSLAGKVLRIDPITGAGLPDNPFFVSGQPARNRSKVWAYGLRNPFRIAVHPTTGQVMIGEVGWTTWEEIDTGKGANFGWPCYEGGLASGHEGGATSSLQQGSYRANAATASSCQALYAKGTAAVKAPVYAYDHSAGGASANGGAYYTGTTYPAQYRGALFIADYSRRWLRVLKQDGQGRATVTPFGTEPPGAGPVQVVSGPDTNLYWLRYDSAGGEVRRIRYVGAGNTPPVPEAEATPTIGTAPLAVRFTSDGSYDPDAQPLAYRWDFGDGVSSTAPDPSHTYTTPGVYDARLTITETTAPGASASTTVRITVGNNPPLATITSPPDGTTYAVGDAITVTGRATSGGEPVPAADLRWEVRLRHNDHLHFSTPPAAPSPTDPNVSVATLAVDEHGDDTSYQVCLTAEPEPGITDTRCIDLVPRTTEYTVATDPIGMPVNYEDEGLALSGPATIRPVVGSTQTLSVDPVEQSRTFVRWSDGVTSRSRTFTVGTTPQTFTAIFENRLPTARITASGTSGTAPLQVGLDGGGSSDPEGDQLRYAWTDGKGNTSAAAAPTFGFADPGTYRVALTVTDQLGATAQASVDVTVSGLPASPSAVRSPGGQVDLVSRGPAGDVLHRVYLPGRGWQPSRSLGGGIVGAPTIERRPNGLVVVWARGVNGQLYSGGISAGVFQGWVGYGGVIASRPYPVTLADGSRWVVCVAAAGSVYYAAWSPAGAFLGWHGLGGQSLPGVGPAVVAGAGGRATVVAPDHAGLLQSRTMSTTGAWSPWTLIGGSTADDVALTATSGGVVDAYVRGLGSDILYTRRWAGGSWGGWQNLGPGVGRGPFAAFDPSTGLSEVWVTGVNGLQYQRIRDAAGWSPWYRVS